MVNKDLYSQETWSDLLFFFISLFSHLYTGVGDQSPCLTRATAVPQDVDDDTLDDDALIDDDARAAASTDPILGRAKDVGDMVTEGESDHEHPER